MKKAILFIISFLLAVSAIITTSAHSYSHFPNGQCRQLKKNSKILHKNSKESLFKKQIDK